MFFQISEELIILGVGREVLELGDKLVHQALYGDRNNVALDDELGGCHDDYLDEGEGENVAQNPVLPFIQHCRETGADANKRRGKEKGVDKLRMESFFIQKACQDNRTI